ncbi:terpenoid synthase [Leucogyrophana mollusca]|uniref:Terpenoid synthase n=1 Tax=Leucogyrophana mollusca TaxID=85980 RepID=A0ACB8BVW5_9AGAM|nr:terpenoid synthase [Leucogyrophana mollusca]
MHFFIPETLSQWPWPRRLNSRYKEVGASSRAWVNSFNALDVKAQRAFDLCDFNQLRACCDMMNLFFVFDDLSDCEAGPVVRQQASIIMDALMNPASPRPQGECVVGEITRQFWSHTLQFAKPSPLTQRRFIESFDSYTAAVAVQAEDRDRDHIRDFESYLVVRRDTIGTYPCFVFLELGMDLPEDVLNHPLILELERCITDMICLANDLYSYNVEQARGDDGHNAVTVVMYDFDLDLDGALAWIDKYCQALEAEFMENAIRVPSWGEEIDAQVARYIDGLGNWARANEAWSFETPRYFGNEGLLIQKHRKVELLPKRL